MSTQSSAAAWDAILDDCAKNRIGRNKPYAAQVRRFLQDATPEALRPAAERAVALAQALFGSGRRYRAVVLALAAYAVVCRRRGAALSDRVVPLLISNVGLLDSWELLDIAGEALRSCDPVQVDRALFVDPVDIHLIGHVGGADRAARIVAEIRAWPKGAFGALKRKANAAGRDRDFRLRFGYDAKAFAATVEEGLAAFGQDAVGPIIEALEAETAQDALLLTALAKIGGPRSVEWIASELASSNASRRKVALAAWASMASDDAASALTLAKARASGAVRNALDELSPPQQLYDVSASQALDESNGEAWATLDISLTTLDALLDWWARHISSDTWFSPRPAFAIGLKAHAHLSGAAARAVAVLERVPHAAGTIHALLAAFGEPIHEDLAALLRQGRAQDEAEMFRCLVLRGLLSIETAIECGATKRLAVREQAFAVLSRRHDEARRAIVATIEHTDSHVRAMIARLIEVHCFQEAEAALRTALAREKDRVAGFVQKRALAVIELARGQSLSCARLDTVLADFSDEPRPNYVPGFDGGCVWIDGNPASAAAIDGFLACVSVEDELAPSPLAQLAARHFAPGSADAWAATLFIEKPNMAKKAEAFRVFASVMCMSEERLDDFVKRARRRTSSPLYKHLNTLLARRGTPVAEKYLRKK